MKIAVIGTGYVGLVTGTGFSEYGNEVICVDVNKEKISKLNNNIMPIYEPGLEALVKSNKELNRLKFTTDIKYAVHNSDIIFIAVGTPPKEDGEADLSYIYKAAEDIGKNINSNKFVVDKSTVPVGTADKVKEIIKQNNKTKFIVNVISNPEFLKEGTAINDFIYPDRIVIGADCEESFSIMRKLYSPQCKDKNRIIEMDIKSAELTKYAANAMLATRISFMNELANISEKVGADINKVRLGIGSDSRIGPKFLYPGCGYGGSCFPKDVKAIISTSKSVGYNPTLLQEVDNVNNRQKIVIYKKIINRFKNIKNKVFGIWGLSFKPDTDDMREAPSIYIIKLLIENGAKVKVYDPQAMLEAKSIYLTGLDVEYCNNKYDCINNCDAMVLLTEWKEFKSPDFEEIKKRLNSYIIFDGRNQYDSDYLTNLGFEYYQIGK